MAAATHTRDTEMHSDVQSSGTHDFRERENTRQNRIQSKKVEPFQRRLVGIRMARLLAALLLVPSLATPTTAQERTHKSVTRAHTNVIEGRQIAAPPWSAACMTDHGPSECGEPMWIYGTRSEIARYRNAF
jgi:hypothetical protein